MAARPGPVYSPPAPSLHAPHSSPALVDGSLNLSGSAEFDFEQALDALVSSSSSATDFSPRLGSSLGTISADTTPLIQDELSWDGTLDPSLFDSATWPTTPAIAADKETLPALFPISAFAQTLAAPLEPAQAPAAAPSARAAFTRESSTLSSSSSSRRTTATKPTGFRTDIAPLSSDAPIQKRQYLIPSSTSRKRNPSILTRELEKRVRLNEPYAPTDLLQSDVIPSQVGLSAELESVVEKKRKQNTLAARRSRERKIGRLKELEDESDRLREANARLEERLARMESVLKSVGLEGMI